MLAELPELDVLVPVVVVEQGELEELEEAILVWLEVLLVGSDCQSDTGGTSSACTSGNGGTATGGLAGAGGVGGTGVGGAGGQGGLAPAGSAGADG